MKKDAPKNKPILKLKPHTYQPTKAELEKDVSLPTTPDELLSCVVRDVKIIKSDDA